MAGLVPELRQNLSVSLLINLALERLPLSNESPGPGRALVVRIIDVLDHGLTRMEDVGIRHVVHEQQQLVGTGCERLVHPRHRRAILTDETGACSNGAVHPDALFVSAVPLAPAISLGRFNRGTVVNAYDVGQSA